MKLTPRTLFFVTAITLVSAGNAFATDQTDAIAHDLQHDLGASYPALTVSVSDAGVATVSGSVDGANDRARIKRQLLMDKRINKVINLVSAD